MTALSRNDQGADPGGGGGSGHEENTYGLPDGVKLTDELRTWFEKQQRAVLAAIPNDPLAPIPDEADLFKPTDWDEPMARACTPYLSVQWDQGGKKTMERLGLDPGRFEVTSPKLKAAVKKAALSFCESTNATTGLAVGKAAKKLRAELTAGLVEHGESIPVLTRRVEAIFTAATKGRAQRIAATETSRAYHAAQLSAAEESGVVAGFELLLSGDACPLCRKVATEAHRVKLGDAFAKIGHHADYSEIRHPPLHPLCQCTMIEVLTPEYGGPTHPDFKTTLDQPKAGADYTPPEGTPEAQPQPGRQNQPIGTPKPKPKPVPPAVVVVPPQPGAGELIPPPPPAVTLVPHPEPGEPPIVASPGLHPPATFAAQPHAHFTVPDRVPKPEGRDTVHPLPINTPGTAAVKPTKAVLKYIETHGLDPNDQNHVADAFLAVAAKKAAQPKPPPKPKPDPFPSDPTVLTVVRPLGGHGGGNATLVTDAAGKMWVRKTGGTNPGQLREEVHADAAYEALGVKVARSRLYEPPGGGPPIKLAEYLDAVPLGELLKSDPARAAAAMAELRKGFVADCLLGNWDVVGASKDNVLVAADGSVIRADNGGALRYRAQGALKASSQWSGSVGELDSLRSAAVNPASAAVFGSITTEEIRDQAKAIIKKRAALLKALPADLHDVANARLDTLEAVANAKPPKPVKGFKPTDPAAFRKFTPGDRDAMDVFGNKAWEAWGKSLTKSEEKALGRYTGSGYHAMNGALRSVPFDQAAAAALSDPATAALARALERGKTTEPLTLWRGVKDHQTLSVYNLASLAPGMAIKEPAFTSTSLNRATADAFADGGPRPVLFQILAPAGTPAGYANASKSSTVKGECELILPPGRAHYRVVSVDLTGPRSTVVVTLIP